MSTFFAVAADEGCRSLCGAIPRERENRAPARGCLFGVGAGAGIRRCMTGSLPDVRGLLSVESHPTRRRRVHRLPALLTDSSLGPLFGLYTIFQAFASAR